MLYKDIDVNQICSHIVICSLPDSGVKAGACEPSSLFMSPLPTSPSARIIYPAHPQFFVTCDVKKMMDKEENMIIGVLFF